MSVDSEATVGVVLEQRFHMHTVCWPSKERVCIYKEMSREVLCVSSHIT